MTQDHEVQSSHTTLAVYLVGLCAAFTITYDSTQVSSKAGVARCAVDGKELREARCTPPSCLPQMACLVAQGWLAPEKSMPPAWGKLFALLWQLSGLRNRACASFLQGIVSKYQFNKKWYYLFGELVCCHHLGATSWAVRQKASRTRLFTPAPRVLCAAGATCLFAYLYVRPLIRKRLGSASR